MKILKIIIFFLLISVSANAQKFKLGKVTEQELLEKTHPTDTSASAAILYRKGKSYFEINGGYWNLVTEVETRIKIYKKEGYEYATEEVGYYSGGRTLKVFFTDAYTYNLVDGKIEKTKLKSDGKFEEKVNEDYTIEKITMPNVKEGSVIEYKYVINSPYFTFFRDWYFQYSIPVNDIEYEVAIPTYFEYNRYLAGYTPVEQSELKTRSGFGSGFQENFITYSAKNVKALKTESYVNNIRNYMSILKHELAVIRLPNSNPEFYADNWESVANKIYDHKDFGKELKLSSYFQDDVEALVKATPNNEDKVEAIFNYVKNRMAWNEENSYYCDRGVKKAYADKVGNTAEINLMLVAMLRYAGFNANPVLVSTRSHGVALYPNRSAYNYVVAGVLIGEEQVLFDATSKYTLPGILPIRALNWNGRLIRENGTTHEIDLMPKINSKEIIQVFAQMDAEGKVTGKARDQYYDYNAFRFRENYLEMSKDTYLESMEKRYTGIEIDDYETLHDKDLSKPLVEEYSFVHNGLADIIGDRIYINPMLYFRRTENPFKQEVREYPVDFVYPHQDKYMISITIPEGYEIEFAPEPVALAMEQNIGSFKYNINAKKNIIQLSVAFDINYANISQDYYTTLKSFYQKLIEKQNEKIILKKV